MTIETEQVMQDIWLYLCVFPARLQIVRRLASWNVWSWLEVGRCVLYVRFLPYVSFFPPTISSQSSHLLPKRILWAVRHPQKGGWTVLGGDRRVNWHRRYLWASRMKNEEPPRDLGQDCVSRNGLLGAFDGQLNLFPGRLLMLFSRKISTMIYTMITSKKAVSGIQVEIVVQVIKQQFDASVGWLLIGLSLLMVRSSGSQCAGSKPKKSTQPRECLEPTATWNGALHRCYKTSELRPAANDLSQAGFFSTIRRS